MGNGPLCWATYKHDAVWGQVHFKNLSSWDKWDLTPFWSNASLLYTELKSNDTQNRTDDRTEWSASWLQFVLLFMLLYDMCAPKPHTPDLSVYVLGAHVQYDIVRKGILKTDIQLKLRIVYVSVTVVSEFYTEACFFSSLQTNQKLAFAFFHIFHTSLILLRGIQLVVFMTNWYVNS